MKRLILFVLLCLFVWAPPECAAGKKTNPDTKQFGIHWLTHEQGFKKRLNEPKPIFIDVYTDWCKYCKIMESTTYKDRKIVQYMNRYFHAVKMNPEQEGNIEYDGKAYTLNQFVTAAGVQGFPASIIFDKEGKFIFTLPGYHEADRMLKMLSYFKEELYKQKVPFEEYIGGSR